MRKKFPSLVPPKTLPSSNFLDEIQSKHITSYETHLNLKIKKKCIVLSNSNTKETYYIVLFEIIIRYKVNYFKIFNVNTIFYTTK